MQRRLVSLQTEELQIQIIGNENFETGALHLQPTLSTGPVGPTGPMGPTGLEVPSKSFHLRARDPGAPGPQPGNNIVMFCGSRGALKFFAVST
jgi:hypothetical protein